MATAIPFLRLYRKRLIFCGVFSLVALLVVFWAVAGRFGGLGVFWNQDGAMSTPADVWTLLYLPSIVCCVTGVAMGNPTVRSLTITIQSLLGLVGETKFLLTRPVARVELIRLPAVLATVALVVFPIAPVLLLGLWLWAVHAPALGQVMQLMRVVPQGHLWRFYAAAFSLGLCVYALMASQRWTATSDRIGLKFFSAFIAPLIFFGQIWLLQYEAYRTLVLMGPPPGAGLDFAPSLTTILLHLTFAVAVLYWSWRLAEVAEM